MNPEEKALARIRFERNFVVFPYIIFAIIVFLCTTVFDLRNVVLTLFGIFFIYNGVMLFVAFLKHYRRTMVLLFVLTILVGLMFGFSAATYFMGRY